jgi:hypothetical protein
LWCKPCALAISDAEVAQYSIEPAEFPDRNEWENHVWHTKREMRRFIEAKENAIWLRDRIPPVTVSL